MAKQHFFLKLIPPRATFPADITDAEKAIMGEHTQYAAGQFQTGMLLVYGPVMAASGAFGMAVIEADDEAGARRFAENDPAVKSGLMKFELSPMHVAAARAL